MHCILCGEVEDLGLCAYLSFYSVKLVELASRHHLQSPFGNAKASEINQIKELNNDLDYDSITVGMFHEFTFINF